MGSFWSRSGHNPSQDSETLEFGAYRYPPKSGTRFFSNHFIMGGEKFDSPQPESFLFGDNSDLNFLNLKPVPFPYPPPQSTEPTKTLKSLIHIRRDSLHFVKVPDSTITDKMRYTIEFTFDCDVRCSITIYHLATEEIHPSTGVSFVYKSKSDVYKFKRGSAQLFSKSEYVFEPELYSEEELNSVQGDGVMPIVIHCVSDEDYYNNGNNPHHEDQNGYHPKQSHTTIAVVEKSGDGGNYVLKAAKQKIFVDGLSYLLQEIYGLENKLVSSTSSSGSTTDNNNGTEHPSSSSSTDVSNDPTAAFTDMEECGAECVVCMCDLRDTIILPCRHLCLCNACADSLRYQASNCPICRAPFRALLQIRSLHKVNNSHPATMTAGVNEDGIPPGYVSVSLVESLNGPIHSLPCPIISLQTQEHLSKTENGESSSSSSKKRNKKRIKNTITTKKAPTATIEDDDEDEDQDQDNNDDDDNDDDNNGHHNKENDKDDDDVDKQVKETEEDIEDYVDNERNPEVTVEAGRRLRRRPRRRRSRRSVKTDDEGDDDEESPLQNSEPKSSVHIIDETSSVNLKGKKEWVRGHLVQDEEEEEWVHNHLEAEEEDLVEQELAKMEQDRVTANDDDDDDDDDDVKIPESPTSSVRSSRESSSSSSAASMKQLLPTLKGASSTTAASSSKIKVITVKPLGNDDDDDDDKVKKSEKKCDSAMYL